MHMHIRCGASSHFTYGDMMVCWYVASLSLEMRGRNGGFRDGIDQQRQSAQKDLRDSHPASVSQGEAADATWATWYWR